MSEPTQPETPVADPAAGRGVRALTQEEFSFVAAVGGVRGLVESVAPGLLFVVVYLVSGQRLVPAVVASAGAAALAVVARLVQRTPVTQALSGVLGVGIGVVWALMSGRAENYFAWGLWVNLGYMVGTLVTILVRWPLVGVLLGLFDPHGPLAGGPWSTVGRFRHDRSLRRRATAATWIWVAVFAARLAVQVPLYFSAEVAWLGTAKLVMGVPLFALALWFSWVLVRPAHAAARPPARPDP
ncbi:MAG: DUF3159 domain-containing protein [Micrococcales bacterium]|nr:DUF3159 domain-containing protein [Micrococcales bacterium]